MSVAQVAHLSVSGWARYNLSSACGSGSVSWSSCSISFPLRLSGWPKKTAEGGEELGVVVADDVGVLLREGRGLSEYVVIVELWRRRKGKEKLGRR